MGRGGIQASEPLRVTSTISATSAFADITTLHGKLIERRNYLDASGNGAIHPNDYLQRVYAQLVLKALLSGDFTLKSTRSLWRITLKYFRKHVL